MDNKKTTKKIQAAFEEVFKNLPPLPTKSVDAIFKITPIVVLVFGILGTIVSIGNLSILSFLAPVNTVISSPNYNLGFVAVLGSLASSVMMLMAYPSLKSGKLSGWDLLFWSQMVSLITGIIGVSIGIAIFATVGFYLLFQIKPKFK